MENGYFIDSNWQINLEGRGRRINTVAAILLTPVMGLMFLMFLPAIGFYLAAKALVVKISDLFRPLSLSTGEAHFTGHEPGVAQKVTPEIEKLDKEIQSRRK